MPTDTTEPDPFDAIVDAPIEKVLWVLGDNDHRTDWVDRLAESVILEKKGAYDFVVFGATGTTGGAVVRYLASHAPDGLRWAIAGRDRAKLESVRSRCGLRADVLVADLADDARLAERVSDTRVVLNTAGPFALLAEPLIRACARRGIDYVDVTGETAHVRRMIDRYHDVAKESGARIVPFCGFDSIPSDLGVLLLVDHFRRRGSAARSIKGFVRATGGIGPGTLESTRALLRNAGDFHAMREPELLSPGRTRGQHDPDPAVPVFDPDIGAWVGPSPMGPINTRVVRRSAILASYGENFRYTEHWDPGGPLALLTTSAAAWATAVYQLAGATPLGEALFSAWGSVVPPTDAAFFRVRFVGASTDGTRARAEVAGFGDPATDVTATLVSESALTLAFDDAGTRRGGVLTPASALGMKLVERLRATGMVLAITECLA